MADNGRIPEHVTIIMDGNGRWARERGKERVYGHFEGVESVRAVTETAVECGVKYLSLYAFSKENWNRPKEEVKTLMSLFFDSVIMETSNFMKNGIKFVVCGDLEKLSDDLRNKMRDCMELTSSNSTLTLVLFINYSGKWDILQAANRYFQAEGKSAIDEKGLEKYLVTSGIPDPDLMIRTSGECRISNYMLWQTAYTEYYFTDIYWPDFRGEQFKKALEAYARRERRFGKVDLGK